MTERGLEIEGGTSKRYRVIYGGSLVGDWETARGAWDGYRQYEDNLRPVSDPDKKYRYQFFDGRQELNIGAFRNAVKAGERKDG